MGGLTIFGGTLHRTKKWINFFNGKWGLMFGGAYGDARMPNWPHWHCTPLPGIATTGLCRDNGKWGTNIVLKFFPQKSPYQLNESQKIGFGGTFSYISVILLGRLFPKTIGLANGWTRTYRMDFMNILTFWICSQGPSKWKMWLPPPLLLTHFWSRGCQNIHYFVPKYR